MKIIDAIQVLEQHAPLAYQEPYDNAGLLTGNPQDSCTGILCTLDATEAVIHEAVERGCNMVVAHHPIVFSGLKSITGKHYVEKAIIAAIKNNIAIYAIHTNLDNIRNGVNDRIADQLGLVNRTILSPKQGSPSDTSAMTTIGSGLLAELPEPMAEIHFLHMLKTSFELELVRHTTLLNKPIQKVAICGGAGSFLTQKALESGAQIFITSDVKYHEFFEANDQMVLADIGHWESEQYTSDLLVDLLQAKFPTFAVLKSGTRTNPVHYFLG